LTCSEEADYPKGTFKGKCKVEDKHGGSWGLPQEKDLRDGRAAFFVDTSLPHSGRHSGRVWLPSATAVTMGMPGHTTNLNGAHVENNTAYEVELYARSFPPGMSIAVTLGAWTTVTVVPSTPLGLRSYSEYRPTTAIRPVVLGGSWTKVTLAVPQVTFSVWWPLCSYLNGELYGELYGRRIISNFPPARTAGGAPEGHGLQPSVPVRPHLTCSPCLLYAGVQCLVCLSIVLLCSPAEYMCGWTCDYRRTAAGVFPSGSVWIDDVSIRNLTAVP
jgi:hypothetical protein